MSCGWSWQQKQAALALCCASLSRNQVGLVVTADPNNGPVCASTPTSSNDGAAVAATTSTTSSESAASRRAATTRRKTVPPLPVDVVQAIVDWMSPVGFMAVGGLSARSTNLPNVAIMGPADRAWSDAQVPSVPRATTRRRVRWAGGADPPLGARPGAMPAGLERFGTGCAMREPRIGHSVCLADRGRSVVVAGGSKKLGGEPLTTVELLDLETGKWTIGPSMNVARSFAGLCTLPSGCVLSVGGISHAQTVLSTAERLDLRSPDPWVRVAHLGIENSWPGRTSAVSTAETAWPGASGGAFVMTGCGTIQRYDEAADSWNPMPELGRPRQYAALGACGGSLWVVGGAAPRSVAAWSKPGSCATDTVEKFTFSPKSASSSSKASSSSSSATTSDTRKPTTKLSTKRTPRPAVHKTEESDGEEEECTGHCGDEDGDVFECDGDGEGEWEYCEPLPCPAVDVALFSHGSWLVCAGGVDGDNERRLGVNALDTRGGDSAEWEAWPDMSALRGFTHIVPVLW
ncbi:hypothetical protein Pelo_2683 [Pelomyxa schiedti]|nr:hypothetical protein Pelo_2683 [Pelomyxa schiedti]